jgi:hypothetical protein
VSSPAGYLVSARAHLVIANYYDARAKILIEHYCRHGITCRGTARAGCMAGMAAS